MRLLKIDFYNKQKINCVFLCSIAATIPFTLKLGNIVIILAVAYNLFFFNKVNFYKLKSFKTWFPIAFFLIAVISSILSKNIFEGFNHLDLVLLPVIIIIIIIINTDINKDIVFKVLKFLLFSSILSTLILLFHALFNFTNGAELKETVFHNFTKIYDQHPVYYSLYLSLSLFYTLSLSQKSRLKLFKNNLVLTGVVLILILGLIFCASKAVLVFNIMAFLFFYVIKNKSKKRVISSFLIILLLSLIVFKISFITERFQEGIRFGKTISSFKPTNDFSKKKIFTYEEKTNISDLELRYVFGSIGLYHLVKDKKIFLGYGQGDTEDYLNYYYFSYNLGPNWYENFNVHNQYLHILIMYGVFVLVFFLWYLFYSLREAFIHKNAIHLFFLLLTCFVFIFEVILVRNKGIIFFYFFNSLFLLSYSNFENSNTRN